MKLDSINILREVRKIIFFCYRFFMRKSINKTKIRKFMNLLEQQAAGDQSAIQKIRQFDPTVEYSIGNCLFNLYLQWESAFSFEPGQIKALKPILHLARSLEANANDDTLKLFRTPQWKELVTMRGPFECAIRYRCKNCGTERVGFGSSGFDDRYSSVCCICGDVWVQSSYDDTPLSKCQCGGEFLRNECSKCGSSNFTVTQYFSSYEYFMDHNWRSKKTGFK